MGQVTDVREKSGTRLSVGELEKIHRKYLQTGDKALADQLVYEYRHLAMSLARRMSRRHSEREDVTQVAMIGLLKAVNRFDPDRGVGFATFAWRTIEGEVKRYFRDSTWTMHVPRSLQERSVLIGSVTEELTHELGRSPTIAEIGDRMALTEEEVVEVFELHRACRPMSIDVPDEEDEGVGTPQIGQVDGGFDLADNRQTLTDLINMLPQREQLIVRLRFVDQLTQTEIANRIGVSQMHVSRMLSRSLARLREASSRGAAKV